MKQEAETKTHIFTSSVSKTDENTNLIEEPLFFQGSDLSKVKIMVRQEH